MFAYPVLPWQNCRAMALLWLQNHATVGGIGCGNDCKVTSYGRYAGALSSPLRAACQALIPIAGSSWHCACNQRQLWLLEIGSFAIPAAPELVLEKLHVTQRAKNHLEE